MTRVNKTSPSSPGGLLGDYPPVLMLSEAAEIMRMSPEGYRNAVRDGRLPGFRYEAGGWRVLRDELEAYLNMGRWGGNQGDGSN